LNYLNRYHSKQYHEDNVMKHYRTFHSWLKIVILPIFSRQHLLLSLWLNICLLSLHIKCRQDFKLFLLSCQCKCQYPLYLTMFIICVIFYFQPFYELNRCTSIFKWCLCNKCLNKVLKLETLSFAEVEGERKQR